MTGASGIYTRVCFPLRSLYMFSVMSWFLLLSIVKGGLIPATTSTIIFTTTIVAVIVICMSWQFPCTGRHGYIANRLQGLVLDDILQDHTCFAMQLRHAFRSALLCGTMAAAAFAPACALDEQLLQAWLAFVLSSCVIVEAVDQRSCPNYTYTSHVIDCRPSNLRTLPQWLTRSSTRRKKTFRTPRL